MIFIEFAGSTGCALARTFKLEVKLGPP